MNYSKSMQKINRDELKELHEYLRIFDLKSQLPSNNFSSYYSHRRYQRRKSHPPDASDDLKDPRKYLDSTLKKDIDNIPTDTSTLINIQTLRGKIEDSIWQNQTGDDLYKMVDILGYISLMVASIHSKRRSLDKANEDIINAIVAYAYMSNLKPEIKKDIRRHIESNLSVILGTKLETRTMSEFVSVPTNTLKLFYEYGRESRYEL